MYMANVKVKIYNAEGKEAGEKELDAKVFGVAVQSALVHEVVTGIRASARRPWAHTKTRGEVSGGGKKPWKQKGTGRARHGSIRSPIWIGGGITFGPRSERNYTKKINRKAKQRALAMTLSDKVANDRFLLVEAFGVKDGKTREMASYLKKLPVSGKVTLVAGRDEKLMRSSRNLPSVNLVGLQSLGVMDVLGASYVLCTVDAAEKIQKSLAGDALKAKVKA